MPTEDHNNQLSELNSKSLMDDDTNWVDEEESNEVLARASSLNGVTRKRSKTTNTVVMVETAFLASAASLIWLINYYFPVGPFLKIFFPIPIALIYLRRGNRASVMSAIVSGLLLLVLMGPTRSVIFLIPYGLMGVQLGACWHRRSSWLVSIGLGALIGSIGMFFRFWLTSILVGEDLWVYVITQITEFADWVFLQLGILAQPDFVLIQFLALGLIIVNNLVYLFAVHLVALMLCDRLGDPISRPPEWVRVLLDY
ncbi:MAG: DUF2232 domain-containing protein [Pleurocapsa sp.]